MVGESDNWGKVVAVAIWSRGEVDGGHDHNNTW